MSPLALLKRSDAPLWLVYTGIDSQSFAEALSAHQAFLVEVALVVPCPANGVTWPAELRRNGWFEATHTEVATIMLSALSPPESPAYPGPASPAESAETAPSVEPEFTDDLWTYVAPCASKEADLATEVRAALIERIGKKNTKRLLASCVATVAKDATGHKNRVLKSGSSLLKLRR